MTRKTMKCEVGTKAEGVSRLQLRFTVNAGLDIKLVVQLLVFAGYSGDASRFWTILPNTGTGSDRGIRAHI